jgi:hypothetical protein
MMDGSPSLFARTFAVRGTTLCLFVRLLPCYNETVTTDGFARTRATYLATDPMPAV